VKLLLKLVLGLVVLVMVAVGGFAAYINATWDVDLSAVEKPAVKASTDPEVIARGEYVAHSLAHCSVCHVAEEVTLKRQPGEKPPMIGGYEWKMGPIGTLRSRNITPDPDTGIGKWTDEELARAIRWGVDKNGKKLVFMTMSVPPMSDEDLTAVVSYLRSTQPVKNVVPPHEVGFVGHWFATLVGPDFRKPFQAEQKFVAAAAEPSLERGKYLANGPAMCFGCHTPFDMMSMKVSGAMFSGSDQPEPDHKDDSMVYRIPNLTPDPETGHMAKWDEEQFVQRLKTGRLKPTSKMPYEAYRDMTESDMRSIFRYLKSLPPTRHYIGPTYRKASEDPAKDGVVKT
jgi:mono/diheme cytochrome c family protein